MTLAANDKLPKGKDSNALAGTDKYSFKTLQVSSYSREAKLPGGSGWFHKYQTKDES
ncbi:MAG: hypothetical protein MI921_21730 [Cytophagales bacterium]|nr:hypothetical protein [Cytophagales bacterium]